MDVSPLSPTGALYEVYKVNISYLKFTELSKKKKTTQRFPSYRGCSGVP